MTAASNGLAFMPVENARSRMVPPRAALAAVVSHSSIRRMRDDEADERHPNRMQPLTRLRSP